MRLVGYTDKLSVEPTQDITFMVSSESARYSAALVRLIHGDVNPAGPGFKAVPVDSPIDGEYAGRHQPLQPGSFLRIAHAQSLDLTASFTLQMWIRPTMPDKDLQTLISKRGPGGRGWALRLHHGQLELELGAEAICGCGPVRRNHWYFVAATFDCSTGQAQLNLEPSSGVVISHVRSHAGTLRPALATGGPVLVAAEQVTVCQGLAVDNFFNGKIDSPKVFDHALTVGELSAIRDGADHELRGTVAAWDFSRDISSWTVTDVSGNEHHGTAVNKPMRGATGWNWTGAETAWPRALSQYGAIHFHDDDLADAGWQPSFSMTIPDGTRSGLYAVHLQSGPDVEDFLPFAIAPRLGASTARIALVLPAFSYLAYANEQMLNAGGLLAGSDPGYPSQPQDTYIVANGLRGLYDRHTDGSGVCYSSLLRPLVNMRPKYTAPWLDGNEGSPHQLNADLHIVDWLEQLGYEYDVFTDFELHRDGDRRLGKYAVVITGSHHEYWSGEMLDAAQRYLRSGGRMINLAGNGMYWVTQLDSDTGTSVEIRRRGPSQRNWEPEPGEAHLSSTGELGGIWRYRGHSPQSWLGVGFTAEGVTAGRPYARQPDSFKPAVRFIFEGIGDDEEIGSFPSLVNSWGAAGFEIDRADHALGTPDHVLVVATARGFTDGFQMCSEEVMVADSQQGGTVCPRVRADMTFLQYPEGGAVFSTGSISWSACLSHNGYENNVSRITRNVLDRFASPDPFDG